ncbi:MAG: TonB-dependent receptor [Pseudorhodoplanes sp.]|nr:TonB-dependent receptor [Pseudorhodoplanes sp.]
MAVKHHKPVYGFFARSLLTALLMTSSAPALAQSAPAASKESAESSEETEIVVVAQRREQRLQDVGISVSAISAASLDNAQITRGEDLALLAPGLSAVQNSGSAVSLFTVRGVGQADFADHHEQPNAIYEDQVYVGTPVATGFPLIDLARVEVLRGPQGTLFGRNATGGVVHFISNAPTLDTAFGASASFAERNNVRVQGFLNGGLGENLAARLSLYFSRGDGYIKNPVGPDLHTDNNIAGRLQFKATAGDTNFTLRLQAMHQRDRAGTYAALPSYRTADGIARFLPEDLDVYGTGPGNDFYGYRNRSGSVWIIPTDDIGYVRKDVQSASLVADHKFSFGTLTSVSNFTNARSRYFEDSDGTPNLVANYLSNTDAQQFTQELRLNGSTDKIDWTAGAYFIRIDGEYFTRFDLPTFLDLASQGAAVSNRYTLDTTSWAIFGQAEYALTDRLTFILGARYTSDRKRLNLNTVCTETGAGGCAALFFAGLTDANGNLVPTATNVGRIRLSRTDNDWSGRAQLNYKPSDDVLLYLSANKGIKGGGFTIPLDGLLVVSDIPFAPEQLFAYEAGFKSSFADNRVRLNGSVFYYDYKNLQTFQFVNTSSGVLSRPAEAFGGELELSARLTRGWNATVGVAYNDFKVKNIATPTAPQGEKQRPILAPELQVNWGLDGEVPVASDYALFGNYSGTYVSSRYFNVVNVPVVRGEPYTLHNLTLGIKNTRRGWSVAAFATNLFNEEVEIFAADLTALGYSNRRFAPPRQVGARVSWNY